MEKTDYQRDALKAEQRQELVERWRRSGQSQKTFCQEHNLKYNTFVSWVSKIKKGGAKKSKSKQQAKGFAEVKLSSAVSPFAEIKIREGVMVNIFHPVSSEFIRSLIY